MNIFKRLMLIAVCCCVFQIKADAAPTPPNVLFSDAVKAYHAADYALAIQLNEDILSQGFSSAAVYYNLGNAYLKTGHLGRAIVQYLRAQRLIPRDSDLKANLIFARSRVENHTEWAVNSIFNSAVKSCSLGELAWVTLILLVSFSGIFLWLIFAGILRKRILVILLLPLLLTGYFLGAFIIKMVSTSHEAVCIEKSETRFEPNEQATVYFKIPEGTEVKVLRRKEDWLKIERPDGKTGWVLAKVIDRI